MKPIPESMIIGYSRYYIFNIFLRLYKVEEKIKLLGLCMCTLCTNLSMINY